MPGCDLDRRPDRPIVEESSYPPPHRDEVRVIKDPDELTLPPVIPPRVEPPQRLPHQIRARFPILPRTLVPREDVWQRLDAATTGNVTVVVAPAGAGKTLGAAGWIASRGLSDSTVWVTVTPEVDSDALSTLLDRGTDRPDRLLVLDDAHRLPADAMALLDQRLATEPDSLHVLMLARWDLPLTRLVPELLGHMSVLRGGALRLTSDELAALVREHARTDSPEVVEAVGELADGWCAIAVLAAKAVRGDRDPVGAARRMLHRTWPVGDRVLDEAFSSLTSRQRHLLLCVASEPSLTPAVARHLTQDPGAEQALDELESTGLLVTRHEHRSGPLREGAADQESTIAIHPLLREVIQRRIRAGGVDVVRASASVRRAVSADVAQGDLADAFRRLLAMDCATDVVNLLASHGILLAERGALVGLRGFLVRHAAAVEQCPSAFLAIALERWWAGDAHGAAPWLHRFLARAPSTDDSGAPRPSAAATSGLGQACARLLLARGGEGDLAEAVVLAETELLTPPGPQVDGRALRDLVSYLTGAAHLRLGHLGGAQRHLGTVAADRSAHGRSQLTLAAGAQLAITQFLLGREHACLELAEEVSHELRVSRRRKGTNDARLAVDVARGLAVVQRVLAEDRSGSGDEPPPAEVPATDDPVVAGLSRLLTARTRLLRGAVAQAEQALLGGSLQEALPPPVARLVAFEQALQAVLASDWRRLARLELMLTSLGAEPEAMFVAGMRADGADDVRTAMSHHEAVAAGFSDAQPPVSAMSHVCLAQLLDAHGSPDDAVRHLAAAVSATEVRRNALPFLGWSKHGTPVAALFNGRSPRLTSSWARRLATETARRPGGIMAAAEPVTPTPHERAQVPDGVLRPSLSPRERDVLHQLARGATYADIAAHLYVSENTVKTHVSSLYAKLAVSRRSDALAVARTLQLL
jgi:ATP/maltotriose-dependent transcriptional regulator MalT